MKKDEALTLREKLAAQVDALCSKLSLPALVDDAKLYHAELDGENLWMQRFSRPGAWPHIRAGEAPGAPPGLRYEVWYFAKREEALVTLLCGRGKVIDPFALALGPAFKRYVQDGKYARRYTEPDAILRRVHPAHPGIVRRAALKKEEKRFEIFEQLLRDTLADIDAVVAQLDPEHKLPAAMLEAARSTPPTAALLEKFGKKG